MRNSPGSPVPVGAPPADVAAPPARTGREAQADASVVRSVRGVPSWAAVVIAVVCTAIGALIDGTAGGGLGWGLRVGFVVGVVLAVLAVRRGSIFTAMVQPPLVLVVVLVIAERIMVTERVTFLAIKVVNAFPTMAVGTAVALLLGLIRILAQPIRGRRPVEPPGQHV